ncbi:MAG: pyridoxal-dependent decarboxylase [Ignavibacteriaceae bacterium]
MKENKASKFGDMPIEEFRKIGHQLIDRAADYIQNIENYPVLSQVKPGEIKNQLPFSPPEIHEEMDEIISDFNKIVVSGITHWNHPGFMAYFNSSASMPGILAELLISTFNVNGMVWKTSPVATELEEVTLNWFRQMLGLSEDWWGIIYDCASVTSMHAIAAARENLNLNIRKVGMGGRTDLSRLRLYTSEHAHSSIEKGAVSLGIGFENVIKIPSDNEFKMIPAELRKAIAEDRTKGWIPFCAAATVGTTSSTSIDPLNEIADICKEENLWLHVDAAHGGIAAMLPEKRDIFAGIEKADSLVVNPHKWMFTPLDLSVFYTKKPDILKRAFSLVPEYLKTKEDTEVINYMDYGIPLGRRFRSLKLWFIIRYFGVEGIRNRIREHIRIANDIAAKIDEHLLFERMAPVPFSTICFRAHPPNVQDEIELEEININLMNKINETGKIFLSHTKLNNKFVIRITIGSIRTSENHVKNGWELIQRTLESILDKK